MILFIISLVLVFTSVYFITSVIAPKKSVLGLIYFFILAFAQIVLTFEILSLFTAIKQFWVLGVNALFLAGSAYIWNKKSRPLWSLDYQDFRNKVINSLKLDKSLMWLYVGFCIFIISTVSLNLIMPTVNADAMAYHVARSLFWVLQGSLKHFEVADIRNLCLPINSEILYSWVFLFVKKDVFFGFFSFVGYLMSIISVYKIMELLGYCVRKRLWVIFILSSFSSVIVQASGTETDIIIAGLISSSILLFWYALKNNKKTPIFMGALAYALAVGTKTTAIIAMPGVGLFLIALSVYFKKYKPLMLFLSFGLINFLIFSSYNYILNYLQFKNFMGSTSFMVVSKNYYGIKGAISNFIKYIFMFIDFTGFRWSDYVGPNIVHFRNTVLTFLHLNYSDGLYTRSYTVNRTLLEPLMGAGILGFLVYLPCVIWSIVKPLFQRKSKKNWFIFAFAILFILNVCCMSYLIAYMVFSVRFMMSFMVLSAPILIYSYLSKRNPLKYIIIVFSLFYLMGVSTHLWARPFFTVWRIIMKHHSVLYMRRLVECKSYSEIPQYTNGTCVLINKLKEDFPKKKKILAFVCTSDNIYYLKLLEYQGYKIDTRRLEDIGSVNFDDYDIVISTDKGQTATFVQDYERRKDELKIINKKFITTKEVPCAYIPNSLLANTKSKEKDYPFEVICGMSKKFIDKKHLKNVAVAGLKDSGFYEYNYYTIFVNNKNK